MNYTTAVFLINKHVRAIVATYETGDSAVRTTFKTLDPTIAIADFIIVPTDTRHKMTVCKVVDVDTDIDFDSTTAVAWVIGKVDRTAYEATLLQEAEAVKTIKSAELRQKRDNIRNAMFADHMETLRALPIAAINGDDKPEEAAK